MNRSQLLLWLSECTGDEIWSIDYCRKSKIPAQWIEEMRDAYESGFNTTEEMIFYRNELVNHFEGIRDVDLACKIAQSLRINVAEIVQSQFSRTGVVRAIREAIEEG